MIAAGWLRLKYLVAEHGREIGVVLAVVSLLAISGAGYAALNPPTETVTEQTHVQTVSSKGQLVAVVTGESALWDRGTRLVGSPFYPREAAPNPKVEVRTTVPSGREVSVTHEVSVVYRAAEDGRTLWESSETLVSEEQTVSDGEATSSAPLPIDRIAERNAALNSELTGITRVNVLVEMNVSYATDRYSGTVTRTAPLTVGGSGYWLGGGLGFEETRSTPVTHEETGPRDFGLIAGLVVVGIVSAGGAAASYKFRDLEDPAKVKHELDMARSHEWVSTGRIRQPISGQDVSMDSLEDLVDVAIDSKRRVVFDADRQLYAVFDNSMLYYFDPVFDRERADIELQGGSAELERAIRSDGAGDNGDTDDVGGTYTTPERDAWDRLLNEGGEDGDD